MQTEVDLKTSWRLAQGNDPGKEGRNRHGGVGAVLNWRLVRPSADRCPAANAHLATSATLCVVLAAWLVRATDRAIRPQSRGYRLRRCGARSRHPWQPLLAGHRLLSQLADADRLFHRAGVAVDRPGPLSAPAQGMLANVAAMADTWQVADAGLRGCGLRCPAAGWRAGAALGGVTPTTLHMAGRTRF